MLLQAGNHSRPQIRDRAGLDRDLLGQEVAQKLRVLDGACTVADTVNLERPDGAPNALRSGRFSRVGGGPEAKLSRLGVDFFVGLGGKLLFRAADPDPDDSELLGF